MVQQNIQGNEEDARQEGVNIGYGKVLDMLLSVRLLPVNMWRREKSDQMLRARQQGVWRILYKFLQQFDWFLMYVIGSLAVQIFAYSFRWLMILVTQNCDVLVITEGGNEFKP